MGKIAPQEGAGSPLLLAYTASTISVTLGRTVPESVYTGRVQVYP
jgi:hypothetical protein